MCHQDSEFWLHLDDHSLFYQALHPHVCFDARLCMYVYMYACMDGYIYIYHACIVFRMYRIDTYLPTYVPPYPPAPDLPTSLHTYRHTYIHTHTHTSICRYIHAYIRTMQALRPRDVRVSAFCFLPCARRTFTSPGCSSLSTRRRSGDLSELHESGNLRRPWLLGVFLKGSAY